MKKQSRYIVASRRRYDGVLRKFILAVTFSVSRRLVVMFQVLLPIFRVVVKACIVS